MLISDVHIDRPLTNFAVMYRNKDFIADQVVPFVPVMNKSDSYFIFTKKDKFTIPETIRGLRSEANQVTWSSSTSSFNCIDHAIADFLPDNVKANADPAADPRERTTRHLTDLLLLAYERKISALVTTYGNYGSSYRTQLSGADQFDKYATSDPLGVVEAARAGCFYPPNLCVMGELVFDTLKHHPQILDRIKGGGTRRRPAIVKPEQLAVLFEVSRVLVGKAKYNAANAGQAADYQRLWGKVLVLAYVNPAPGVEDVSAWKAFRWKQVETREGYKVRSWRDEASGGGGEWIETEQSYDEKAVCTDVAYLIDAAIA